MLKRSLAAVVAFLLFLPLIAFAEGTVATVTGSSLIKKGEGDWQKLKEGDVLEDGEIIKIEASSSVVLKVNNEMIELSGGPEESDITIINLAPLNAVINGTGIRYISQPAIPPAKPLPEPPSLSPPASTKTSTTFRWKRKSESERYHLQISRNRDFSEIAVELGPIEGPRVTVALLEEGDYFVRVSAIGEEGVEGRFSEPQSFYVGPKVPSSNIGPLMIMFGVAFMLLGL